MTFETLDKAKEMMNELLKNNYEAYIVGGYVRDHLLGKSRSSDIDIATNADADTILKIFNNRNPKAVGKSFLTVIVDGIEISPYRQETFSENKLHETAVEPPDGIKEDTHRRDFTINSLAMDVDENTYDFHDGKQDINKRVIRFVGSPYIRIFDDPLRMIRACRFLAYIDGRFDNNSFEAINNNAHRIKEVATERIRDEILKTMSTTKNASKFFIVLYHAGILKEILPTLFHTIGISQNKHHKESVFTHNVLVGDAISTRFPLTKLAGYLHDIGKIEAKQYNTRTKDFTFYDHQKIGAKIVKEDLEKLKFSNDDISFISSLILHHMRDFSTSKSARKTLRALNQNNIDYNHFLRLRIADRKGKLSSEPFTISQIGDMFRRFKTIYDKEEAFSLKHLKINGKDVMEVVGIKQGPEVGEVLENIFEIVIERPELNEREALLNMLRVKKMKKAADNS